MPQNCVATCSNAADSQADVPSLGMPAYSSTIVLVVLQVLHTLVETDLVLHVMVICHAPSTGGQHA